MSDKEKSDTGYAYSRAWFNFCFENTDIIRPVHTALYFFVIEHRNRLGWKEKFGLPSQMCKDAIGVRSHNTYKSALNDLVEWGFIKMIEESKNQYSANIIALLKFNKAQYKALDKATITHSTKHRLSTVQSIDNIDKPLTTNHKPITREQENFNSPIFYDLLTLKEKLENDFAWMELSSRRLKIPTDQILKILPEFFLKLASDGEEQKTLNDTKKHFNNWYESKNKNGKQFSNKASNGITHEQFTGAVKNISDRFKHLTKQPAQPAEDNP